MMRQYKYKGTDGNGGFYEGITKKKHGSMADALTNEIYKVVHSCLKCEAV